MRLDESFHMRYTMLQNTLLVTISSIVLIEVVCGLQNLDAILIQLSKSMPYVPILIVMYQCFNEEPNKGRAPGACSRRVELELGVEITKPLSLMLRSASYSPVKNS